MQDTEVLRESIRALGTETTQLIMRVDALHREGEITTSDKLAYAEILESASKEISLLVRELRYSVAQELNRRGLKTGSFTGLDGTAYTVEVSNQVSRRAVKTDELVKAVEKVASATDRRLNPETGEIIGETEAKLQALKQAFRMEPRWSTIKDFGINDDEYCSKSFELSAKITKAVAL